MNSLTDLLRDYLERASQGDQTAWEIFQGLKTATYRQNDILTYALSWRTEVKGLQV